MTQFKYLEFTDNYDILIFTDLHAHEYKKFNSPESEGYGSRLKWILTAFESIINYAIDNSIKHIFFLGDLLHHRTMLYSIVLDKIIELIEYGQNKGIVFHFILGNHDYIYNSNESPSIVTRLKEVDIVSFPTIYKLPTTLKYEICCTPFRFDIATQEAEIIELSTAVDSTPNNVLLGHLELSGAHVNDEYVLSDTLRNEIFQSLNFEYIFTGHIHSRQLLSINRESLPDAKIEYVGVPIQHTFNEENKPYGFTTYNCLTKIPSFHNLSDLCTVPEFISIEFSTQEDIKNFLSSYQGQLDLNYYKFKSFNHELKTDKLFSAVKFYTYEYVGTINHALSEEESNEEYNFNLDFERYLLTFLQQEENTSDYSWFTLDNAQLILDEIYQRGNLCLK